MTGQYKTYCVAVALFVFACQALQSFLCGQEQGVAVASRPEKIEWTWEVRPPDPDPKLPNVLLIGDSITRNYFPEVTQELSGMANVYLLATSACVGDLRLLDQIKEFVTTEGVRFAIVHFNNGMHGWKYSEVEYRDAFPGFLAKIQSTNSKAHLIWASTTPVKADSADGATNGRIDARNAIALSYVRAESIVLDDQHSLMMEHQDLYQDPVHFNEAGSRIQAHQATEYIRKFIR